MESLLGELFLNRALQPHLDKCISGMIRTREHGQCYGTSEISMDIVVHGVTSNITVVVAFVDFTTHFSRNV